MTLSPTLDKVARSVRLHKFMNVAMGADVPDSVVLATAQVALNVAHDLVWDTTPEWSADLAREFLSACGFSDEVAETLISDDQPDCWY